jgi:glycosyltransferase involved in cell wall biosynthesis
MKRILIFSLAYYPNHVGGAEVAIKEITDRIDPSDIEFHLITLRFEKNAPKEERVGNVCVYRVGIGGAYLSKILFILLAALKGLSLHRQHRFDGAWAMMSYMLFPIVLMRFVGARMPYALTLQEGDPFERVFGRWYIQLLLPLLRYGFRHASVVQSISKYLGEWVHAFGFTGSVEVIPNGANSADFDASFGEDELQVLREQVGKREGDVYMVTTSRLVHKNGIDTVIRALPLLPGHVHFLVVGGGEDEELLTSLTKELDVESRVHFVGHVDRMMTPRFRAIADIFVRPSRSEGMGNSLVSAFAAGLPVIATQEGGIADFLYDAKRDPEKPTTGWAVDKESPEQIAEAVKDILADPERTRRVVETAKRAARETYHWDEIAKAMQEKVFARVLAD